MVLFAAQMILCNFLNLTQLVTLSILPAMILMLPITCSPVSAMLIAFAAGITMDLLCDGVLGLNAMALVPVALCRQGIIRLTMGSEVFARKENISIAGQGMSKIALASMMAEGLFMILYVWADGAGTRSIWHNIIKIVLSTALGTALSLIVAKLLSKEYRG